MVNKIKTFVNTCLRKILKIRGEDKIRNDEIWKRAKLATTEEELRK